jgi:hypothetical protein
MVLRRSAAGLSRPSTIRSDAGHAVTRYLMSTEDEMRTTPSTISAALLVAGALCSSSAALADEEVSGAGPGDAPSRTVATAPSEMGVEVAVASLGLGAPALVFASAPLWIAARVR